MSDLKDSKNNKKNPNFPQNQGSFKASNPSKTGDFSSKSTRVLNTTNREILSSSDSPSSRALVKHETQNNKLPILKPHEREVQPLTENPLALPLEPKYTDLLQAAHPKLGFKEQMLAVGAILIFSLVLVGIYSANKSKLSAEGRGVAGQLNDLSNGSYSSQSADYSEEKVCTEHSDGTKSCTTRTKLRREFR